MSRDSALGIKIYILSDLVKKARNKMLRMCEAAFAGISPAVYYKNKVSAGLRRYSSAPIPRMKMWKVPNIVLEASNTCNLNCLMCKTLDSKRDRGEMSRELLEYVVGQKRKFGQKGLAIHTVGEPLIYSYFEDVLRLCTENGIRLRITTNGLLLKKRLSSIERYPDSIAHIAFSTDGAKRETYEKIRRGARFDELLENLDAMQAYNKKANKKISISMQACLSQDNFDEIPLFHRTFSGYFGIRNMFFSFLTSLSSQHENKRYFNNGKIDVGKLYKRRTPCRLLWNQTHVLYDGSVSACCRDYNGELIVGDVKKSSILDIWNGDTYRSLRQKHMSGDVDGLVLCRDCYGVDKRLNYIFSDYTRYLFSRFKNRPDEFYMDKVYAFLGTIAETGPRGITKEML